MGPYEGFETRWLTETRDAYRRLAGRSIAGDRPGHGWKAAFVASGLVIALMAVIDGLLHGIGPPTLLAAAYCCAAVRTWRRIGREMEYLDEQVRLIDRELSRRSPGGPPHGSRRGGRGGASG